MQEIAIYLENTISYSISVEIPVVVLFLYPCHKLEIPVIITRIACQKFHKKIIQE